MFEVDINTGQNIPRNTNNPAQAQNPGGNGGAALQAAPQANNAPVRNRNVSSDSMETQAAFIDDSASDASYETPDIRPNATAQGEPLEERTATRAVQYTRGEVVAGLHEAAMEEYLEEALGDEMLSPEDYGLGTNQMTMGDDPRRALMTFDRPASDDSIWDMPDAGSIITESDGAESIEVDPRRREARFDRLPSGDSAYDMSDVESISTEGTTDTDETESTKTGETDTTASDDPDLRYGRSFGGGGGGGGFFSIIGNIASKVWSFITGPFRRA
jgi:hypothetical protein